MPSRLHTAQPGYRPRRPIEQCGANAEIPAEAADISMELASPLLGF